jgi:hypothetical protein
MNAEILKEDLLRLKGKLENLEEQLQEQIKDLEVKEEKWKLMDEEAELIKKNENKIIWFNVSGRKFATKVDTLLSMKDTLFYKLILCKKFDLSKEVFFDRNHRMFSVILDYIRYKKIYYQRFSKEELNDLRIEADYFEVSDISDYLREKGKEIEMLNYEFSGQFISGGTVVGTNKIEDISDPSRMKGICAISPGWIIIELNYEHEITEIEIGGYQGNNSYWSPENGAGAQIQTSVDKKNWITVGTVPYGYGTSNKTVQLTPSTGKFIRFFHTSYMGVGYLSIKK